MIRIKRGKTSKTKRKKILQASKSFRGSAHRLYRLGKQRQLKSETNNYQHRKWKKRIFRKLWINRINAINSLNHEKYSEWIYTLRLRKWKLDRKSISQLYLLDSSFKKQF